jgi:NTE family protein
VGLALGSGSARGWSHVGVIRALEQIGIRPDLVCGTSVGALVGAAYAAGKLDRFEQWLLELKVADIVGFMDFSLRSGLFKGQRMMDFFRRHFDDRPIESLQLPFGAVATALQTGAEVWLRSGSTLDAVRASIALPGVFAPVTRDDVVLVDGGLANPVPVSLARAMGADIVIAVDLGTDILGRHIRPDPPPAWLSGLISSWVSKLKDSMGLPETTPCPDMPALPSLSDVIASSINIMQVRISRSRLAGDPPDVTVEPRLAHFRLLDFHRGKEAMEEGRRAVERVGHGLALLKQHAL